MAAGSGGSEAEGVARKETNPEAGCLCCLHTHIARQHWLLWNRRKSSDLLSLKDTLETIKTLSGCTKGWPAGGSHGIACHQPKRVRGFYCLQHWLKYILLP